MKLKDLVSFLGLEALALAVAGGSFALIPSKLVAGLVAGAYFIASSSWMLRRILLWPARVRLRSLTLYPLLTHLFVVSLPMVATRLMHADADFAGIRIWGLPGPVFHRVSTNVFGALIAATVLDVVRVWRGRARARNDASGAA